MLAFLSLSTSSAPEVFCDDDLVVGNGGGGGVGVALSVLMGLIRGSGFPGVEVVGEEVEVVATASVSLSANK